jgi:signal transduction histidine kinase
VSNIPSTRPTSIGAAAGGPGRRVGTFRLQRFTIALAAAWAGLALAFFLRATLFHDGWTLPVHTNNTLGRVIVSWAAPSAAAAGVRPSQVLVSIDGIPYLRWGRDGDWRGLEPGHANRYVFERRSGERFEVSLEPISATDGPMPLLPIYLASLAVGCAFLAIGILVWLLRRGRREAWAFTLFCCAVATQLFSSFDTFRQTWGYERSVMNFFVLAATEFHLFTTYPFEPRWIVGRRWLRGAFYALAGAAVPLVWLEGRSPIPYFSVERFGFWLVVVVMLGCLAMLTAERRRRRGEHDVARADVLLLGAGISFVPVIGVIVAESVLRTGLPVYLALLWFVVFPISVAYGIVKKELFDIRHLARSSVAYGASTLAITGAYALLVASADAAVVRFHWNARSPGFTIAFLFCAILAFNPIRNRMQALVDRVFDRGQGRYRQTVREVSEAMVSMLSVQEIVERIVRALSDAMGVERSMVLLLSDDERALGPEAVGGAWPFDPSDFVLPTEHPVCKYLWMRREEVAPGDLDDESDERMREGCRDVFDRLDVALLVPVLFGVDLLGVIAVGRKLSGDRFTADDRQLLLTLANQSSIAIENARAFDEIAKLNETLEARVEERTRELRATQAQLMQSEKMRTLGQLVAGVAHELNNPIGFVHANLKLLEEYVAKLARLQEQRADTTKAREAIGKLLARSREGTERVTKIVADLRAFSRMDQGELAEADLNDEIERTIALMEPRCKNCIAVERDFGDLPRVRCHAGQLNQAFLNLLINACDAIGDRGHIVVRTRAVEGGVRLEFEDDGPGIPPPVRDKVFEPFFTTKPVGQGTGLGLSLTHGIIERHGGRIWVESEGGRGTRFVIELPLAGAPGVAA